MIRRSVFALFLFMLGLGLAGRSLVAAEKLRFGTSLRTSPHQILPPLAAEEAGFWKKEGLEVQWVPFEGGTPVFQAAASSVLDMGISGSLSAIQAISRGIPIIIVADTGHKENYYLWVRADSPVKEVKDLRGTKIDVARFGGVSHAYGRLLLKAVGLEKDVKLVAMGGITPGIAALLSGAVDGRMSELFTMGALKFKGQVREIIPLRQFLPEPWLDLVVFVHKDFVAKKPDLVKKAVRAILGGTNFVMQNKEWAIKKMVSVSRYSEEAARFFYPHLTYTAGGYIKEKGVESVRNFLLEYGLILKERTPALETLFTKDFLG